MKRIEEARDILKELQVPVKQQSDMCCYVLLAMAQINKRQAWADATNNWIRIHDIIGYIKGQYNVEYAENSRETIRIVKLSENKHYIITEMQPLSRITEKRPTVQIIVIG